MKNIGMLIFYSFSFLILFVLIFKTIRYIYKSFKEDNDPTIHFIYWCIILIFLVPEILYFMDIYNIPTLLGYTKNVSSDKWFDFFSTYASSILSAVFSSAIVIYVTFKQIEKNSEENFENNILQNLPILKYDILESSMEEELISIATDDDISPSLQFSIVIENVGLNTARKIFFNIESTCFRKNLLQEFCEYSLLNKGEKKKIAVLIENLSKGTHIVIFTFYYKDSISIWLIIFFIV